MTGERYIDKAVETLGAWLEGNLPAALRAVETAQGLAADSLTDPIEVIRAAVPDDNRSPLVQVYEDRWRFAPGAGQRHGLMIVDCAVVLTYACGTDITAGQRFMRRYVTALLAAIEQDPTLGGAVVGAIVQQGDNMRLGDASSTRLIQGFGVDVHVHTP